MFCKTAPQLLKIPFKTSCYLYSSGLQLLQKTLVPCKAQEELVRTESIIQDLVWLREPGTTEISIE